MGGLPMRCLICLGSVLSLLLCPSDARAAQQMQTQGLSRKQIANRLEIPEWLVKDALRMARAMAEHNLDDAFVRIESRPTRIPAKWRQSCEKHLE